MVEGVGRVDSTQTYAYFAMVEHGCKSEMLSVFFGLGTHFLKHAVELLYFGEEVIN